MDEVPSRSWAAYPPVPTGPPPGLRAGTRALWGGMPRGHPPPFEVVIHRVTGGAVPPRTMQAPPSPRRGISAKRPGCSRQSPNARPKRGLTRGFLAHGGLGSRGVIGAGACLAYPIRAASRSLPPSQACPSSPPPTVRGVRGPRRLEGRSTRELQRQMGAGWALGRARTSPGGSLWMTPRPPSLLPFAFFFALLAFFLSPSYNVGTACGLIFVFQGRGGGKNVGGPTFVWQNR